MKKNKKSKEKTSEGKKLTIDIRDVLKHPIVSGLFVAIFLSIGAFIFILIMLPEKIDSIREEIREIKKMNETTNNDISDLFQRVSKLEGVVSQYTSAIVPATSDTPNPFPNPASSEYIFEFCRYDATPYMMSNIEQDFAGVEAPLAQTSITYLDSPVAIDPETDAEYTASELSNKKIIFSYQDEQGRDVYFCGQFSEDGCWTGSCILNIYEDGNLVMISDAIYDNGRIVSSKQCYQGYMLTAPYSAIWSFSFRTTENGYRNGETWRYFRDASFPIAFATENLTDKDFITANGFFYAVSSQAMLVEYYSGATSEGVYNDNTGNAFRLINFSDGTVRTFYAGQFKDRNFHDSTGDAWMIGKVETEQPSYVYYKGRFENGEPIDDYTHWRGDLTLADIEQILKESGISYPCPLNWGE